MVCENIEILHIGLSAEINKYNNMTANPGMGLVFNNSIPHIFKIEPY